MATGEPADYVLLATASELTRLLHLVDCRFELETGREDEQPMPTLARDGSIDWGVVRWEAERWGFPSDGVAIPVWSRGRRRGRFVLVAPIGRPYDRALLRKAMALVDQVGAAVAA